MARLFPRDSLQKRLDREDLLRHAKWRLEALVLAAFWLVSGLLSPDRASAFGRGLVRILGPRLKKTRHFRRNLMLAFPDKTDEEVDALTREAWGNVGAVIAEFPHLGRICGSEAASRVEMVVRGNVEALSRDNKRAVYVTAHLANWEVPAALGARLGIPLTVVYTAMTNPLIDRMLRRRRAVLDCDLLDRHRGMRPIVRVLANGGAVALVVDQRVDTGAPVPFFGLEKPTTVVPARLALRSGCELVPVRVERLRGARFRVTVHEPLRWDDDAADDGEKVLQMTRKMNALFETWIREKPQEWMCSNRRFPKTATRLAGT
ncbi:MAG: lysophospholipid acyltransferase family protein [Alphaproteobacteria bacterium]